MLICFAALPLCAEVEDSFKNKVNLALRQTGHQLLLAENDSTTTIAPIQYVGDHGYILSLERGFDYERLPIVLENALGVHGIDRAYDVIIRSCDKGEVVLGYGRATMDNGEVACSGRDQASDCAEILLQFEEETPPSTSAPERRSYYFAWLALPLFAVIGLLVVKRSARPEKAEETLAHLRLGRYAYDPKNQELFDGEEKTTLTFRENKLLHYFMRHPNQVLTREEIQSAVWEDEGVIVGRSLDVFISRLRKLLKRDDRVQIKNVHGVGYRLELP